VHVGDAPIGSSARILLSRQPFGGSPGLGKVCAARPARGASPGDGVFVPVSPVCPLTRPNRMTVSPGPRAGRRACAMPCGCSRSHASRIHPCHRPDCPYVERRTRRFGASELPCLSLARFGADCRHPSGCSDRPLATSGEGGREAGGWGSPAFRVCIREGTVRNLRAYAATVYGVPFSCPSYPGRLDRDASELRRVSEGSRRRRLIQVDAL
jgi:hypothetical protein